MDSSISMETSSGVPRCDRSSIGRWLCSKRTIVSSLCSFLSRPYGELMSIGRVLWVGTGGCTLAHPRRAEQRLLPIIPRAMRCMSTSCTVSMWSMSASRTLSENGRRLSFVSSYGERRMWKSSGRILTSFGIVSVVLIGGVVGWTISFECSIQFDPMYAPVILVPWLPILVSLGGRRTSGVCMRSAKLVASCPCASTGCTPDLVPSFRLRMVSSIDVRSFPAREIGLSDVDGSVADICGDSIG